MAIYHFSAQMISRSSGRSSTATAAYRAAERIVDKRQGLEHDYSKRSGVLHTEILLPKGVPDALGIGHTFGTPSSRSSGVRMRSLPER